MNAVSRAQNGAALAPLSPKQRQKLAAYASRAHRETHATQPFDEWRREEVRRVTGRVGLREARNEDYNRLKAHFLALSGHSGAAFQAAYRAETEDRTWVLRLIHQEATAAKETMPNAMAYVRGFLLKKRGVSLDDADTKALWHALFTLRRKLQKEKAKRNGGVSAGDVVSQTLAALTAKVRKNENPF